MSDAVWLLCYDVADTDRDRYLAWFHDVHVAEKLARPGYTFAAHYAGAPLGGAADTTGYMALFGGESTRIFLDPAPSQLKSRQDALTREMMGLRRNGSGLVLAHEWTVSAQRSAGPRRPIRAPVLEVLRFDAEESDEAAGIWAVQTVLPTLAPTVRSLSKWSSVTAGPRHVLMLESDHDEDRLGEGNVALAPHRPAMTAIRQSGARIWPH